MEGPLRQPMAAGDRGGACSAGRKSRGPGPQGEEASSVQHTWRQEGADGDRAAASRAGRKSSRPARVAPGCKQPSKGGCSCSLASKPAPNLRFQLRRAPPLCTSSLAEAVGDSAALRPPSSGPPFAKGQMTFPRMKRPSNKSRLCMINWPNA